MYEGVDVCLYANEGIIIIIISASAGLFERRGPGCSRAPMQRFPTATPKSGSGGITIELSEAILSFRNHFSVGTLNIGSVFCPPAQRFGPHSIGADFPQTVSVLRIFGAPSP